MTKLKYSEPHAQKLRHGLQALHHRICLSQKQALILSTKWQHYIKCLSLKHLLSFGLKIKFLFTHELQLDTRTDVKSRSFADFRPVNVAQSSEAEPMFVVLFDVTVDVHQLASRRNLKDLTDLKTISF